jgi:hypothetical protein
MSHINAEIKNLFHLIFPVPFIVSFSVLRFKGLTKRINAANPAIKGNSIIRRPAFGSRPSTLKSSGLADSCENTSGFDADFITNEIINGIAPIVLEAIRIRTNITIYLQKLFLPLNADSRWFIVKRFIRIQK